MSVEQEIKDAFGDVAESPAHTDTQLTYLREGALSETVKLFIANPPPNEFSAADVVQFADTLYAWLKG